MNVVITNKNSDILNSLEIDVIKKLDGEFESRELISKFNNFYFSKMILDITALKNYESLKTIQELSIGLKEDSIVLFLTKELKNNKAFISSIISLGIYNFAADKSELLYLIDNPNQYRDVASQHMLGNVSMQTESEVKQQGFNLFNNKKNVESKFVNNTKIIGIKNITDHAGSTTFTYILKEELDKKYNVVAFELDKYDFPYFNKEKMYSIESSSLEDSISKYSDADIILIDMNNAVATNHYSEVLYLMETSILKLNKLVKKDRSIFSALVDKKIILNKSLLNKQDIFEFEHETNLKVFNTIPLLDDRSSNEEIKKLIEDLSL